MLEAADWSKSLPGGALARPATRRLQARWRRRSPLALSVCLAACGGGGSSDNIGVPRNAAIVANADLSYYDLGLCGPQHTDLSSRKELCGAFKVPTLRNIGKTAPYFHNGRFATIEEAIGFYVRRDINPEEWYPRNPDGTVVKFDDLPSEYHTNVNVSEVPYNRKPGEMPALAASEIDDVVAFLKTLTDGYKP